MNPTARPHHFTARAKLVERMRDRLEAQSHPRLQMSLIVSLTGLAGLLASASLLKLGLHSMAWRYPAALLIAYGAFLGLLWLWLRSRAEDWADAGNLGDGVDAVDLAEGMARPLMQGVSRAGNHGVSDNAMRAVDAARAEPSPHTSVTSSSTKFGWADAGDADELAIVLLVLGFVLALAAAAFYVVYQAPVLLAEVALDGALMGSLYHRLRECERQHWLHAAWNHTRWPLLAMLVVVSLVGWGLQQAAPGAVTLGQAWAMV